MVNTQQTANRHHHILIGTPLLLILVFCLSFVSLHSSATQQPASTSAAAHKPTPAASASSDKSLQTPLPTADTTFQTLTPAQQVGGNAPAGSASSAKTASPQGSAGSSSPSASNGASPQNSAQNHGSGLIPVVTNAVGGAAKNLGL